jgi:glutamine---fructose-6-phosphate transaminase (isomerizing)
VLSTYDWELAEDTTTTWRIGDGTAGFYNYVYYLYAGFTEHDTFRSNQIREGQLTRERALELILDENRPRYSNIKWYLDTLGMDFTSVINRVNSVGVDYMKSLSHGEI